MVAERDRLRGLQMGEAGHDRCRHARRRASTSARCSACEPGDRPARSHRAPTAGSRSRPGRCGCARCGAGRRPAPISSASRLSVVMWMSSRSQSSGTPSASYSAATAVEPADDRSRVLGRNDAAARQASRHAPWLAAMSCRQRALSNGIEALISRMIAAGPRRSARPTSDWTLLAVGGIIRAQAAPVR